jgi:hypothetical protein
MILNNILRVFMELDLQQSIECKAFNDEQSQQLLTLYRDVIEQGYNIDCTGDVCKGDQIAFAEAVFYGSWRNAKFSHFEMVVGTVINDSYGADKQQHTFTILTPDGGKIKRKGRNIYKYVTLRKYRGVVERTLVLHEKHKRGDDARKKRFLRRNMEGY